MHDTYCRPRLWSNPLALIAAGVARTPVLGKNATCSWAYYAGTPYSIVKYRTQRGIAGYSGGPSSHTHVRSSAAANEKTDRHLFVHTAMRSSKSLAKKSSDGERLSIKSTNRRFAFAGSSLRILRPRDCLLQSRQILYVQGMPSTLHYQQLHRAGCNSGDIDRGVSEIFTNTSSKVTVVATIKRPFIQYTHLC